jgi:hypothetical protein
MLTGDIEYAHWRAEQECGGSDGGALRWCVFYLGGFPCQKHWWGTGANQLPMNGVLRMKNFSFRKVESGTHVSNVEYYITLSCTCGKSASLICNTVRAAGVRI